MKSSAGDKHDVEDMAACLVAAVQKVQQVKAMYAQSSGGIFFFLKQKKGIYVRTYACGWLCLECMCVRAVCLILTQCVREDIDKR
jgi:hypothetical protein